MHFILEPLQAVAESHMQKLEVTCACESRPVAIRDGRSFEERLKDRHQIAYGITAISLLMVTGAVWTVLLSAVAVA